jgi:fructokinase
MNNSKGSLVTCFGEVLWDVFPDHKKIGGAPLNVAMRLQAFGIQTSFISKIGNDTNGKEILNYLTENNVGINNIQVDQHFETGVVNVTLNEKRSASYEIKYPVAWDKIELTEKAIETVQKSDAFIFGSLVCRDSVSKNTLISLLDHARFKVFDVNLRPPHYSLDLLVELMQKADLVKCNDEELVEICNHFGETTSDYKEMISFLAKKTSTNQVCVTLGENGAALFIGGHFYHHKGYKINVADTVGAGDSFLGTLIAKLIIGEYEPQVALDHACAVGALVASKKGANPKISSEDIDDLMKAS